MTCSEIRRYGLSEVIGSWKIMDTRLPRIDRAALGLQRRRSTPSNTAEPPSILPGGCGTRPMIE